MSVSLSKFSRPFAKRSGGIRSVYFVRTGDVTDVAYNELLDFYSSVTLSPGVNFAKMEFEEDTALLKETVVVGNGSTAIRHELSFTLSQFNFTLYRTLLGFVNGNNGGFLAVVVTNCGDQFLVGYSNEFKDERPLKLVKTSGYTGQKLTDGTGIMFTFGSEDTMPSRRFSGTL